MKKINLKIGLVLALLIGFTNSCKDDFLDVTPNGSLDESVLATAAGVDALLISTYSMLDGVASNGFGWEAASSNWVYGSIRGLEANKGTDAGDQPDINPLQSYSENATNPYLNVKWRSLYDGIARANAALKTKFDNLPKRHAGLQQLGVQTVEFGISIVAEDQSVLAVKKAHAL